MQCAQRAMLRGAVLVALFVAGGCAQTVRKQPVELERFRATALQGDPRLAVMVSRNDLCTLDEMTKAESCVAQPVTAKQSKSFVRCLADGFRGSRYHPDIRSLDADVTLRSTLAELPTDKLMAGDLGESLAASGLLERLAQERVSHVVAFASKLKRNYRKETDSEVVNQSDAIGVGGSSMQYFRVEFSASVVDVSAAALAGRMMTSAEGGSGMAGGVMFVPIPIPIPIPIIFPMFENLDAKDDSCEVLGNAIARFLYSKAQPGQSAQ